jgi:signal transduction histidine kinase
MTFELVAFNISVFMFLGLAYLIGGIWFRGKRNTYLKFFCLVGVLCSVWGLLNGFNLLVSEEVYTQLYPAVMVMVCLLPCAMLRYVLYFTESRFAEKRWVALSLNCAAIFDTLVLLTNPLHKSFISGYDGIRPLTGSYFPVHAVISYVPMLLYLFALGNYVIKNVREKPGLGYIAVGVFVPITFNILYTFNIFDIGFDITPFTFIIMFAAFAVYSIQMRLFDVKNAALTGLFTSLSDILLIINNDGIVAGANPAFMRSFPEMGVVVDRTPAREVIQYLKGFAEEYNPQDLFAKLAFNNSANIRNAEITISMNGERYDYSLSKDIITERGQYAGYIVMLSDIGSYRRMINEINAQNVKLTELKNLAESASNAKTLFLANMSHEIRTPLNAVIGMTQIARGSSKNEHTLDCLDKIDNASKHLLGLINDILEMSKIEASNFELVSKPFELQKMLDNITGFNNLRAAEKKQRISVLADKNIPRIVIADELHLSQVINNLLSNAVKFSPENEEIILSVTQLSREPEAVTLRFSVEDHGIGISQEQQAWLFQTFAQADSGISRKYGGTGLGLSISQKIIELMGGCICIESEIGRGSTFSFEISIAYTDEPQDSGDAYAEVPLEITDGGLCGYSILLVEDIEINREIVNALLEDTGAVIECAVNGLQAVELVAETPEKYDFIFMDIHMPVLDGYEATQRIRKLPHPIAAKIPIVALTANAFDEDVKKAKDSGMNDHLAKPIDIDKLFQKINQYIRWR